MAQHYNIYCDESCHLEHDSEKAMVLGALWCPEAQTREIAQRLRDIKEKHGLSRDFEVKWTKISPAKIAFYLDYLDYFFDDDDLHFRSLVIPDKGILRHEEHRQDHDTWYYKMYFLLLAPLLGPKNEYKIYLDIKDTCGGQKREKLHQVLCNNAYDFQRKLIKHLQVVRSNEVEQVQLADLLIGAMSYVARDLNGSTAKAAIVARIRKRSGYTLNSKTLLKEEKFNIFRWMPNE